MHLKKHLYLPLETTKVEKWPVEVSGLIRWPKFEYNFCGVS